jgi:simple sugar transport system permease protein
MERLTTFAAYALALALTLFLGAMLIIIFIGKNPIAVFGVFFAESFFSNYGFLEILAKGTPILIASSGMVIAFRCGLWNLGAEGQMAIGAIISTALGVNLKLPGIVLLPIIFVASFIGGGLWSAISGYIKNKFLVNEILSTLMLNYIALKLMEYLIRGPMSMKNPIYPRTPEILIPAQMLFIKYPLNSTLIIALVIIPVIWFLIHRTNLGFRLQAVGLDREAARLSGMDINRLTLAVMFISGGICAVGGTTIIVGDFFRLERNVTGGYGFIAILVVMMARENIVALPFVAFLISGLIVGAASLTLAEVPATFSEVLIGLMVLCVVFGNFIELKLKHLVEH